MDGDPAVDPQLDTFSLFLPLPYRIAVIIVLGLYHVKRNDYYLMAAGAWAWGVNLHYLFLSKIV